MPPRPRLVDRLALPLVLAVALFSPARAQDCPVAEMQFNAGGIFVSDAAAFDTVASATKELAYDAPAGTLALMHEGKFSTFVRLNDVFLLGGLISGTPVPVVLELVADGQVSTPGCGGSNCWGYLGVRILADDAEPGRTATGTTSSPAARRRTRISACRSCCSLSLACRS